MARQDKETHVRSVWKYVVPVQDTFSITTRQGAKILSVDVQGGAPCLWAEVDPGAPEEVRHFRLCGTGHVIPAGETRRFVGTLLLHGDSLVFHLFELDKT